MAFPNTILGNEPQSATFKIVGLDSGVGVEVYKYAFLKSDRFVEFMRQLAAANPETQIEIEFSSYFNHDDIRAWEQAAEQPENTTVATMELIRDANKLEPDLLVGACNTMNVLLSTPDEEGKTPYERLIEEGTLQFNEAYGDDISDDMKKNGHRARAGKQTPSVGILDSTAERLYRKSIKEEDHNIITDPAESEAEKPKKAAIIVFSTPKTKAENTYKDKIMKLHDASDDKQNIELDVIQEGVTWARWLNANPDPSNQPELQEQIRNDVSHVVENLLKDFTVNELIEMSPIQVGFCCTHFPQVEEEVMAAFNEELMRQLEEQDFTIKNEIDKALIPQVLNGDKTISFEPVAQGPDLVPNFIAEFRKKHEGRLRFDFNRDTGDPQKRDPLSNITLVSSIEGKTGEKIPAASFETIGREQTEVKERFKEAGLEITFNTVTEDRTAEPNLPPRTGNSRG